MNYNFYQKITHFLKKILIKWKKYYKIYLI